MFWLTTPPGITGTVLGGPSGNAITGWTRLNVNYVLAYNDGPSVLSLELALEHTDSPLTEGYYYPFRILYTNGGGGGSASISITDPYNNPILSSATVLPSVFIMQALCRLGDGPESLSWVLDVV